MLTSSSLKSCGCDLDLSPENFGWLQRSDDILDDSDALRSRLAEDGYLFLPGFLIGRMSLSARDELLRRLSDAGCLDPGHPLNEAKASPETRSLTREQSLSGNQTLPDLVFSPRLLTFYERLLGGPVRHYDHIWLRLIRPGPGTFPHCDLPYMGRGTREVMTAWIPYRDTSLELGGLMMLEKSHLQSERIRTYLEKDADTYCVNRDAYKHRTTALSENPHSLREKFGGRWLTAKFQAGDLLSFGMTIVHASLDNRTGEYRMSTDTRYQLASEPIDERWVGPDTEEWAQKNRIDQIC